MDNIGSKLVKTYQNRTLRDFMWPKICFDTYRVNRYF